jgi:hypothetical protein
MEIEGQEVKLYYYDISNGMATQFAPMIGFPLEGIWHTGIVVFGWEYFYGGGINYDVPGMTPFGSPVKTITLGRTNISMDLFQEFLTSVSTRFTVNTYNILTHNCNNFTNECSNFLLGKGIPEDIVALPQRLMATPLGQAFKPMFDQMQSQMSSIHGSHEITQSGVPTSQVAIPSAIPSQNQSQYVNNQSSSGHPHTKLSFKEIYKKKPYLFTVGNIKGIVTKLRENLKSISYQISAEEEELLEILQSRMSNMESILSASFPLNTFPLIDNIVSKIPDNLSFPCLDIIRLLLLNEKFSQQFMDSDMLACILKNTTPDASGPEQVMTLRIMANLLEKNDIHSTLKNHASPVLDAVLSSITITKAHKQYASIRIASIATMYNIALQLKTPDDLEDTGTQIISSLLHHIPTEDDSENLYWMLMTLSVLLFTNDDGVFLTNTLGINLQKLKNTSKPTPKLLNVIQDVEAMLKA